MAKIDVAFLSKMAQAQAANQPFYVSKDEGMPLIQHKPSLIVVDQSQLDPNDASKIAAKLTDDGAKLVASAASNASTAAQGGNGAAPQFQFQVQTGGIEVPKVKRGGGGFGAGAPAKYPFEGLGVGQFFFVANTDVSKGDAMKTLSSAVGSANQRYMEETGETKTVSRAKRGEGNKAVKGPDGKNVMESVTLPVKKATRKYIVRKVEKDHTYGAFKAPADGAVAIRTE